MARHIFFSSQCHVCLLSNPSFFQREPKEVELRLRERKKESLRLLSQGSFITINCVMTPADIQIDLPSSGDHLACAEVSHTKDSFVSLMKGFLPRRFFKPKSRYFIFAFIPLMALFMRSLLELISHWLVISHRAGRELIKNLRI